MKVEDEAWLVVDLDADREARVVMRPGERAVVVVHEDLHYPLEEAQARAARADELAEVERKIGRGEMRVVKTAGRSLKV